MEDNKLIIYKNNESNIIVDAIYKDETLWLSQKGMSKVFECSTDNISLHLKHINWKNSSDGLIYKYDVVIAKNYLSEEEMNNLKDLTNMFVVFAEDEAKQMHVMTMKDWIDATDDLLKFRRKEILNNSGSISHKEAVEKAEKEYEKFRVIQDQKYISSMDEFYNKYLNENIVMNKEVI